MSGIIFNDNTEICCTDGLFIDLDLVLALEISNNVKKKTPKHNKSNPNPHLN